MAENNTRITSEVKPMTAKIQKESQGGDIRQTFKSQRESFKEKVTVQIVN